MRLCTFIRYTCISVCSSLRVLRVFSSSRDPFQQYYSDFPKVTSQQWRDLNRFDNFVRQWNEKINLVSRKDVDNLVSRHIIPSLALLKTGCFENNGHVVDVGTGGGFPGLPLAIVSPATQFTLLDSSQKKIAVVSEMARELRLSNVQVVCSRAETFQSGQFDIILGRAVSTLKEFLKYSSHLVKRRDGESDKADDIAMLYIKGGDFQEEIRAAGISSTDVTIVSMSELIPTLETDKSVVVVRRDAFFRRRR